MRVSGLPYAGVICPIHGAVDIDQINYTMQMRDPWAKWKCPKCGAISAFDDDRYEELHQQEQ